MTVQELIDRLADVSPDADVHIYIEDDGAAFQELVTKIEKYEKDVWLR